MEALIRVLTYYKHYDKMFNYLITRIQQLIYLIKYYVIVININLHNIMWYFSKIIWKTRLRLFLKIIRWRWKTFSIIYYNKYHKIKNEISHQARVTLFYVFRSDNIKLIWFRLTPGEVCRWTCERVAVGKSKLVASWYSTFHNLLIGLLSCKNIQNAH